MNALNRGKPVLFLENEYDVITSETEVHQPTSGVSYWLQRVDL